MPNPDTVLIADSNEVLGIAGAGEGVELKVDGERGERGGGLELRQRDAVVRARGLEGARGTAGK